MIKTFRTMVVLTAILFSVSPLVDILSPTLIAALSPEERREDPSGLLGSLSGHIATNLAIAALLCFLVSAIGLYRLRHWARPAGLVTSILALLAFASLGEVIYSGLAFATVQMAAALWGGVLFMAYFSEVSRYFANER